MFGLLYLEVYFIHIIANLNHLRINTILFSNWITDCFLLRKPAFLSPQEARLYDHLSFALKPLFGYFVFPECWSSLQITKQIQREGWLTGRRVAFATPQASWRSVSLVMESRLLEQGESVLAGRARAGGIPGCTSPCCLLQPWTPGGHWGFQVADRSGFGDFC